MAILPLLSFFVVIVSSQTCHQNTDLACVQSPKCLNIQHYDGPALYPRFSFEVPLEADSQYTCQNIIRPDTDVPFPFSFAFAAADTVSTLYQKQLHYDSTFQLSAQMLIDCLARDYDSEDSSTFATLGLDVAFEYIQNNGLCTVDDYEGITILQHPSIDRCIAHSSCQTVFETFHLNINIVQYFGIWTHSL